MKSIARIIFLLVIVAGLGYAYQKKFFVLPKLPFFSKASIPCEAPLHYKIGYIDQRFHVTSADFLSDAQQAADIWNNAAGKTILVYDQQAELSINLKYDQRQSLDTSISQQENSLQSQGNSIKPEISQYQQMVADFKTKAAALNSEIASWNQKGGAPADVFARLTKEQQDLQAESIRLNTMAKQLNLSSQNYNQEVGHLNQTIDTFNAALEQKPEEGLFDPQQNIITIYFSVTKQELIHTLAHELGHALGLEHVNNSKAIMYAYTNQFIVPTKEDVAALKSLCAPSTQ